MNRTSLLLPLLAVLSLASTRASAATLATICNRFYDANDSVRCMAAARGLYVDEKALDVCNSYYDANYSVRCIGVVAGREYTAEDIALCNRFYDNNDRVKCLSTVGRPARRVGRGGGDACRDRIHRELNECRRGGRDAVTVLACLERSLGL